MSNGKHGDHPLTDILAYGRDVYGSEAAELIRKIAKLGSAREVQEWWESEIGWSCPAETALIKTKVYYGQLLQRAKDNGWELPDETA